jgi:hypothetical protein
MEIDELMNRRCEGRGFCLHLMKPRAAGKPEAAAQQSGFGKVLIRTHR